MSKRPRKKSEIARDRRNISRLYLKGAMQAEIAESLGLSQPTISRDLKVLQAEWQAANLNEIDEHKKNELAKIDNLELEYWEAWVRSREKSLSETTEIISKGRDVEKDVGGVKRVTRQDEQVGDPRFLSGVQWCIEKRCQIMGLNAPEKRDLTSDDKPLNFKVTEIVVRTSTDEQEDEQ